MKTLVHIAAIACLVFAAGCAPTPSIEALEAEAETTGDWTLVERYERMVAREEARRLPSCPSGQMLLCEELLNGQRCSCSSTDAMRVYIPSR